MIFLLVRSYCLGWQHHCSGGIRAIGCLFGCTRVAEASHAALISLAQIAEGCSKVMVKNLQKIVSLVLKSFQDPHPRVRWAAINAIGQLSTDLGPDLQVQYHHLVLPALASTMDDFQNPRVQKSAGRVLQHKSVY